MSHETPSPEASDAPQRSPLWPKVLLTLSLLMMLGGGALWIYGAVTGDDPPPAGGASSELSGLISGFADETGDGASALEEDELGAWSPVVFRLGLSFFVGFCIAFALRSFLRLAIILIGVGLLAMFGLQYAGIIDVDWSALDGVFQNTTGWLRDQTASFQGFITGQLPSAGSAVAGLVAGFRR